MNNSINNLINAIEKELIEITSKRDRLIEICFCFYNQGFKVPKDIMYSIQSLARMESLFKENPFVAFSLSGLYCTFRETCEKHDLTFNNYFVEPEVNRIW